MSVSFAGFIAAQKGRVPLVVQPRMGFGGLEAMRAGLSGVKASRARAVGTITLDSYTRVNDYEGARRALESGADLNGFPIVTHGPEKVRAMLAGVQDAGFPVQVRHGTALPQEVIRALLAAGLTATEGGPISYCLPYSRLPLESAVAAWAECCELIAEAGAHLESFGGCMLGQLCPPSLLLAITLLEGIFFKAKGVRSLSLSYAQGTHPSQDVAALRVLRRLAERHLPGLDWHLVLYTYMGVYPRDRDGAYGLLDESARVAAQAGCERLIVKTPAEAHRIPTVQENVDALEFAFACAQGASLRPISENREEQERIEADASRLIEAVLELGSDVGASIARAFKRGVLDVPYCLHRSNANRARARIDERGYLVWSRTGGLPLKPAGASAPRVGSDELLFMLGYNQRRFGPASVPKAGSYPPLN